MPRKNSEVVHKNGHWRHLFYKEMAALSYYYGLSPDEILDMPDAMRNAYVEWINEQMERK